MSFDLSVYAMQLPADLEKSWLDELLRAGYECELPPGFKLAEQEFDLMLKVNKFPERRKRVQPGVPLLVWIDFYCVKREEMDAQELLDLPDDAKELSHEFHFRTAAGRTEVTLAIQIMGAVALAKVTRGFLSDPQEGVFASLDQVDAYAADEMRKYVKLDDAGETPFVEWPPSDPVQQKTFKSAPPLTRPKRSWWNPFG